MAEDKLLEVMALPRSTAETDTGPLIESRPDELWVTYDAPNPDDTVTWTTIRFEDAVAFRFTPEAGCTPTMVDAYSRVMEFEASPWIKQINETNRGLELPSSSRHFVLYFDDRGCLEVVARNVHLIDRENGGREQPMRLQAKA